MQQCGDVDDLGAGEGLQMHVQQTTRYAGLPPVISRPCRLENIDLDCSEVPDLSILVV